MGKRKKSSRKKLKGRARRVEVAPRWVRDYLSNGGTKANLLKKYRAKFGIDWECSIAELQALGISFDPEYLSAVRQSAKSHNFVKTSQTPVSEWEFGDRCAEGCAEDSDSDETFAYIAGYTSNGFAFGVTREEMEEARDGEW